MRACLRISPLRRRRLSPAIDDLPTAAGMSLRHPPRSWDDPTVRAPVVALALVVAASGCFPDSARHRRYAKIAEGGALVGGIALQYVAKSNDCMERRPGTVVMDCDRSVARLDTLGLLLIFAGLVGFATTTISGHPGFREADD